MDYSFYKLSSGSDVLDSLNNLNFNLNATSFIISAVGDLSVVSFKCPLSERPIILQKKLEIINLSGYLTTKHSHIHISVSDENCTVFGGHLLSGTCILKSLDILIGSVPNLKQQPLVPKTNFHPNVDIYGLPNCPWSKRSLKLLDSYNIKYNYHLITTDDEFRKISHKTNFNTFPQIFIRNEFIGGYSELVDLSTNGNLDQIIK